MSWTLFAVLEDNVEQDNCKTLGKTPFASDGEVQESMNTFTRPVNENELIEALTDHAHKIAESILNQPETGIDLARDAKVS